MSKIQIQEWIPMKFSRCYALMHGDFIYDRPALKSRKMLVVPLNIVIADANSERRIQGCSLRDPS